MSKFQKFSFFPRVVAILGPMGVGKTLQLMEHIDRFARCGFKCLILKHEADDRYTKEPLLIAHNSAQLVPSKFVEIAYFNVDVIKALLQSKEEFPGYDIVALDEAHLLTIGSVDCPNLLSHLASYIVNDIQKGFIFTAIDRWASGDIVSNVAHCLNTIKPDEITYCKGICGTCKSPYGIFTKKIASGNSPIKKEEDNVEVGGFDKYTTVCRMCFTL